MPSFISTQFQCVAVCKWGPVLIITHDFRTKSNSLIVLISKWIVTTSFRRSFYLRKQARFNRTNRHGHHKSNWTLQIKLLCVKLEIASRRARLTRAYRHLAVRLFNRQNIMYRNERKIIFIGESKSRSINNWFAYSVNLFKYLYGFHAMLQLYWEISLSYFSCMKKVLGYSGADLAVLVGCSWSFKE